MVKASPEFAFALLREATKKIRMGNRKVAGLSYQGMKSRVATTLVQLMDERGMRMRESSGKAFVFIPKRPKLQFIAEMAGVSRESVSRTFAAWARAGIVRTKKKDLFILEEGMVRRMIEG